MESSVGQLRCTLHSMHGYRSPSPCTFSVWLNVLRLNNSAPVSVSWRHRVPAFCEDMIRRQHQSMFNRTLP